MGGLEAVVVIAGGAEDAAEGSLGFGSSEPESAIKSAMIAAIPPRIPAIQAATSRTGLLAGLGLDMCGPMRFVRGRPPAPPYRSHRGIVLTGVPCSGATMAEAYSLS